jgi:hypothetical protein
MVSGGLPFNLRVQKMGKVLCLIIVSMTLLGGPGPHQHNGGLSPNEAEREYWINHKLVANIT